MMAAAVHLGQDRLGLGLEHRLGFRLEQRRGLGLGRLLPAGLGGPERRLLGFRLDKRGRLLGLFHQDQLELGLVAFKEALDDAGLDRDDVDGLSIHMGWPLGVDYDRIAEVFGLDIRYVNQSWLHGRFVTNALQHAALAVASGMADCVACITAISFTRLRGFLGGPEDQEGTREEGGTHGEAPAYGLTAPASGAAMAMQRYMAEYGATSEQLGEVAVTFRRHAVRNPRAVMRTPMSLVDHQASRMVVDPLRLYDCCLITDGAACVLVTSTERARDLNIRPVTIAGMQGIRSGREEFIFSPRGLGLNQQTVNPQPARERDLEVYRSAGIDRDDWLDKVEKEVRDQLRPAQLDLLDPLAGRG